MSEFSNSSVAENMTAYRKAKFTGSVFSKFALIFLTAGFLFLLQTDVFSQTYGQTYTTPTTQTNYTDQSSGIKQEIARLEIKVVRGGQTLPISQVPRVKKGDILKVRLLDEPVGGVKIDQTSWDWTLVVAYANPLVNKQKEETVAPEVNFRKQGWYKEYSFTVPFDSQPVFFLSPRAKYRDEIVKAVNKNFGDLQKIGQKMVEISNAYSQINTFLDELQTVVNRNTYGYGINQFAYNPYAINQGGYNPYGGVYSSGGYSYPTTQYNYNTQYSGGYNQPYNYSQYGNYNQPGMYYQNPRALDQIVERLAKSFNLSMPQCWYTNNQSGNSNSSTYNSASTYGSTYGSTYSSGSNYSYDSYTTPAYTAPTTSYYGDGSGGTDFRQDFTARSQCVAKSINLKDFDISVTRMWQQGGVFFASELIKKYPQFAFYINLAATAIDFIVRAFQKSPLRIVPTMLVSTDNSGVYQSSQQASTTATNNTYTPNYQNNLQAQQSSTGSSVPSSPLATKFSIFSTTAPNDQGYLTAYPVVVQKWQSEPDAEVIKLNTPTLGESCLHTGVNMLKNTSLSDDWADDTFTRDFKLILTSDNGFKKEFPLRKNLGLGGWELNLSPQDSAQIPKVAMSLEGQIVGTRGFSQVKSDEFKLPVATAATWEVVQESQKTFAVGGKRRIALRNTTGDCLCVQSVTYKPSFGGQFTFERGTDKNSLQTSSDGRSVSFEVDTANFNAGQGSLEVKTFGGESTSLNLKLYPALPSIKDVRVAYGDHQILISGERLEQLRYVTVNGYRATIMPNTFPPDALNPQVTTKLASFDDPRMRVTGSGATLEIGLEDDRHYPYPQTFGILPSRPAIKADENNELEGISDAALVMRETIPVKAVRKPSEKSSPEDTPAGSMSVGAQLLAARAEVFPITTKTIAVNVQNTLSDYDFKNESITIETRIERSQKTANDLISPNFEVLDWKTMRIRFSLTGDTYTNLGGRRIQFRIRDKERGDSDWYTIKQTFTRVPQVTSIKCTQEMNGQCEMKGDGMDYVGQVSVDGGKTWYPGDAGNLQAQPTADGQSEVLIPQLINRKLLRLKLRDFPNTNGLFAGNFVFTNTVKTVYVAGAAAKQPAGIIKVNNEAGERRPEPPAPNQLNQSNSATVAPAVPNNSQATNTSNVPSNNQTPANNQSNQDPNSQLPRLPNPLPTQNGQQATVYTGSVQMMDEIIDMGPPAKKP